MATRLRNLKIDRVALVDFGAGFDKRGTGEGPRILLAKRAEPADDPPIARFLGDIVDCVVSDHALSPEQIASKFAKAGRKISAARLATLADLRDALAALIADTTPAEPATKEPDAMAKADLTKLSKAAQDFLASVGVTELTDEQVTAFDAALPRPAVEPAKPEDVLKSAPPELRALVEKAQADVAKAQAEAAEAGKIAKAERDLRVTRLFIEKAQGLDALPGMSADDFGVVLKGIAEKAPDDWAKLEPLLKSAHEAIRTGALYVEKGRGGEGGGSAEAAINAKAAELVAKSATKLTLDEAKVQFLDTTEGKALYQRYLDANPKQTGR